MKEQKKVAELSWKKTIVHPYNSVQKFLKDTEKKDRKSEIPPCGFFFSSQVVTPKNNKLLSSFQSKKRKISSRRKDFNRQKSSGE